MFSTNPSPGIGAFVHGGPPRIGKMKTTISTNNLAMLKIHQNHGRIVSNEQYVFRKIYP